MTPAVARGRVEWIDTDAAGIHHHTAIARYVESAEAALMRDLGLDDYFARAPRVHYEVDYEAPLHFGQEITTTLDVVRLGTSSITLAFEVWGEAFSSRPRLLAARGSYVTVHITGSHTDGGARSAPWPAAWVEAWVEAMAAPPSSNGAGPANQGS